MFYLPLLTIVPYLLRTVASSTQQLVKAKEQKRNPLSLVRFVRFAFRTKYNQVVSELKVQCLFHSQRGAWIVKNNEFLKHKHGQRQLQPNVLTQRLYLTPALLHTFLFLNRFATLLPPLLN